MKFSLKNLILFVTIAAMLCGVIGFSYNRIQMERQRAIQAMMEAEQARTAAEEARMTAEQALRRGKSAEAFNRAIRKHQAAFRYSILHWNVESGGNDPTTIAKQLIDLGRYDIVGLSEVADPDPYEIAISEKWPGGYHFIRGYSGINNEREPDRLLLFVDSSKFDLVESADMQEAGGVVLNNGRHRAPLYVRLKDKSNDQHLIVILNHLAQGDAEFRAQQATGLREWARNMATPIIAIGDYEFDYDFNTMKNNSGFDEFLKDGVWKWIQPEEMIDTNWSDDGMGGDRFPDSMLDFNFVAGAAKDWKAECRVIVRDGDFPDDEKTSDHRPVELILTK